MSAHRNGTPTGSVLDELRETRAAVKLERARAELAQLQATNRLLSESWGGWPDGPGYGWGVVGPDGWRDLSAFSGGNPALDRWARRDGYNRPFVWNEIDLAWSRSQARYLATANKFAVGILSALCNFVVKTGWQYEAVPAQGLDADDAALATKLAQRVQRFLDRDSDLNRWPQRERSFVWRAVRDGEAFFRHMAQPDGTTLVRFVEAEQVLKPMGSPIHYDFGILTSERDIELAEEYAVFYTPDPDDCEYVPADEMTHLKRNVDECVKRGLSDFYCTGESLNQVEKLLRNMQVVGPIQAAIPWIEQFENATTAALSQSVAAARDVNRPGATDPYTGTDQNYEHIAAGSVKKVGKGRTYVPQPQANNVPNHVALEQAALRAINQRWGLPEFFSGDASNNNYASILVSGSPFVTAVECEQALTFKPAFLRARWVHVRNACRAGLFGDVSERDLSRLVDIVATPPPAAIANKAEEAQIDHADMDKGVLSIQTRRAKLGLDEAKERQNLQEEPPPQSGGGQQSGGAGGLGAMFGQTQEARLAELRARYGDPAAAGVAEAARRLLEGATAPPTPAPVIIREGEDVTEMTVVRIVEAMRDVALGRAAATPPDADDDPEDRSDPDERLELIAEILAAVHGGDALKHVEGVKLHESLLTEADAAHKVGDRWQGPSGRWFTRRQDGRVVPAKAPAEHHEAAKGRVKELLAGPRHAESFAELHKHLSGMTVEQLRQLKAEHGLSASGRVKAELVQKLADRMDRGRRFGDGGGAAKGALPKMTHDELKAAVLDAINREGVVDVSGLHQALPNNTPQEVNDAVMSLARSDPDGIRITSVSDNQKFTRAEHERLPKGVNETIGWVGRSDADSAHPAFGRKRADYGAPHNVAKVPDVRKPADLHGRAGELTPAAPPAAKSPSPAKAAPAAKPAAAGKFEPGAPDYERSRNAVLDAADDALTLTKEGRGAAADLRTVWAWAKQKDPTLTPERFRRLLNDLDSEKGGMELHVRNEVAGLTPEERAYMPTNKDGKVMGFVVAPMGHGGGVAHLKRPAPATAAPGSQKENPKNPSTGVDNLQQSGNNVPGGAGTPPAPKPEGEKKDATTTAKATHDRILGDLRAEAAREEAAGRVARISRTVAAQVERRGKPYTARRGPHAGRQVVDVTFRPLAVAKIDPAHPEGAIAHVHPSVVHQMEIPVEMADSWAMGARQLLGMTAKQVEKVHPSKAPLGPHDVAERLAALREPAGEAGGHPLYALADAVRAFGVTPAVDVEHGTVHVRMADPHSGNVVMEPVSGPDDVRAAVGRAREQLAGRNAATARARRAEREVDSE